MLGHCDDIEEKGSCQKVLDACAGVVLLSPLVVAFWRGTWGVIDSWLLPRVGHLSAWLSLALGWLPQLLAIFLHPALAHWAPPTRPTLYAVTSRLYTYVMAVTYVHSWRGPWLVLDDLTGVTLHNALVSFGVGVTSLVLLRAFRSALSPPTAWMLDVESVATYEVTPLFRTEPTSRWHGLDALATVVGVGSAVMLTWRGGWMLIDFVFCPLPPLPSATLSLALGAVLATLLCLVASPACPDRLSSQDVTRRLPAEVTLSFLAWLAAVLYWRGFWRLVDMFLLPERTVTGVGTLKNEVKAAGPDLHDLFPFAGGNVTHESQNVTKVLSDVRAGSDAANATEVILALWLLHAIGWIGLCLARASHSLVYRGVALDAEPGVTLTFSPSYVTYIRDRTGNRGEGDAVTKV